MSSFITVTAAIGIAFYFGWQLALVILAGFPILMFSGYIQVQVQKSGQKKDAAMMEDAGRVSWTLVCVYKLFNDFLTLMIFTA